MIFANILLLALLFFIIIRAFFQLVTLLGTIHYTARHTSTYLEQGDKIRR